jgi:hypothetical protein
MRYRTGDRDDPAEISNDVEAGTHYIEYRSTTTRGAFNGGGGYPSLIDAMPAAAKAPGFGSSLRWQADMSESVAQKTR